MADFCRQCSYEMGFSGLDLSGLISKEAVDNGMEVSVLCEGCGPIGVDHEGWCNGHCLENHDLFPRGLYEEMKTAWERREREQEKKASITQLAE